MRKSEDQIQRDSEDEIQQEVEDVATTDFFGGWLVGDKSRYKDGFLSVDSVQWSRTSMPHKVRMIFTKEYASIEHT